VYLSERAGEASKRELKDKFGVRWKRKQRVENNVRTGKEKEEGQGGEGPLFRVSVNLVISVGKRKKQRITTLPKQG